MEQGESACTVRETPTSGFNSAGRLSHTTACVKYSTVKTRSMLMLMKKKKTRPGKRERGREKEKKAAPHKK